MKKSLQMFLLTALLTMGMGTAAYAEESDFVTDTDREITISEDVEDVMEMEDSVDSDFMSDIDEESAVSEDVTDISDSAVSDFLIDAEGVLTEYNGAGGNIVIPDGVTRIASQVFQDNRTITSVVIPEGVRRIGWQAFYGCKSMKQVTLPSTLEEIDSQAFFNCEALEGIELFDGITLGWGIFEYCKLQYQIEH